MALAVPTASFAHAFVQPYSLPVPFSLYASGAAAALVISFLMIGVFVSAPPLGEVRVPSAAQAYREPEGWLSLVGRTLAATALGLGIVSGFVGTENPFANINMTLFWILFVLGVPYLTVLVGDFFGAINPWRTFVAVLQTGCGVRFTKRVKSNLTYAPAIVLYMAFIWLELFGNLKPFGLSVALLVYTGVNVVGAFLYGSVEWFRKGEFFGVTLRLIGGMSPLAWERAAGGTLRVRWRPPFVALLRSREEGIGLTLFVLFMLSSTAFDGLHSTLPWVSVFWKGIYPHIGDLIPTTPGQKYLVSTQLYYGWQWVSMFLSPFAYLAVFALFILVVKVATKTTLGTVELINRFAICLVPIAFVYHVTHYYTLLLAQGGQIVRLVSDPFGFGWNIFGTAKTPVDPVMVSIDVIWHSQVGLILAGHITSVYLSHVQALRLFPSTRVAVVSQLPLLALMVFFTAFGLWILSLPLVAG